LANFVPKLFLISQYL